MSSPIGGFMPIPLAMMIPFMATQSLVMGDAFGKGFQYGKRKISAMSNEDFNKLTELQLADDMFKAYYNIIPSLQEAITESNDLQKTVINTLLQLPFKGLEGILQEIHDNLQGKGHAHGTDEIHPDITDPEEIAIIKANQEKNNPPSPPPPNAPGQPRRPLPPSLPSQQQAEKSLVEQLLVKQKAIIATITRMRNDSKKPANKQASAQASFVRAIAKQNVLLQASSLNLNKKQAQYKQKYGVWLS